MTKYYKGNLYLQSETIPKDVVLFSLHDCQPIFNDTDYFKSDIININKMTFQEISILCMALLPKKFRKDHERKIAMKPEVDTIFNKYLTDKFYERCNIEKSKGTIIYERFKDQHGDLYGKELYTDLIFPIITKNKITHQTRNYNLIPILNSKFLIISLSLEVNLEYPSLAKCECVIKHEQVADNNEVENYLNAFNNKLTGKRKQKQFIKELEELYKKNVFNEEVVPKKEEIIERESQSNATILMENIEFSLKKLRLINQSLYDELSTEYQNILSMKDIDIKYLASIAGKLEFHLVFNKKNCNNIEEYLENLKKDYLKSILIEYIDKPEMTIEDIDKITELFLKQKKDYSIQSQRTILKNISFIYLIEVYYNINNITIKELNNSYFADNLKTIFLIITSLRDENLIENDILIDLYTDITLPNIIEIIKRIEFTNHTEEEIKKLIK